MGEVLLVSRDKAIDLVVRGLAEPAQVRVMSLFDDGARELTSSEVNMALCMRERERLKKRSGTKKGSVREP